MNIPNYSSSEDVQHRNSTFQRLNKLANTKLLKPYISGTQLIDLDHLDSKSPRKVFKNQKMVKVLEDRAHKAMDNIRKKKKQSMEETDKPISKKLASELEVPSKFFLTLIIKLFERKTYAKVVSFATNIT